MTSVVVLSAISIVLFLLVVYLAYNSTKKIETLEDMYEFAAKQNTEYEDFFLEMKKTIGQSYSHMKQLDRIGSFESDDETGRVFNDIKEILEKLNKNF